MRRFIQRRVVASSALVAVLLSAAPNSFAVDAPPSDTPDTLRVFGYADAGEDKDAVRRLAVDDALQTASLRVEGVAFTYSQAGRILGISFEPAQKFEGKGARVIAEGPVAQGQYRVTVDIALDPKRHEVRPGDIEASAAVGFREGASPRAVRVAAVRKAMLEAVRQTMRKAYGDNYERAPYAVEGRVYLGETVTEGFSRGRYLIAIHARVDYREIKEPVKGPYLPVP